MNAIDMPVRGVVTVREQMDPVDFTPTPKAALVVDKAPINRHNKGHGQKRSYRGPSQSDASHDFERYGLTKEELEDNGHGQS